MSREFISQDFRSDFLATIKNNPKYPYWTCFPHFFLWHVNNMASPPGQQLWRSQVFLPYVAETQDAKMYRVVIDRERWFDVVMGEKVQRGCTHDRQAVLACSTALRSSEGIGVLARGRPVRA